MVTNAPEAWAVLFGAVFVWALVGVVRHWGEMHERAGALRERATAAAAGLLGGDPAGARARDVLADMAARGAGGAFAWGVTVGWAAARAASPRRPAPAPDTGGGSTPGGPTPGAPDADTGAPRTSTPDPDDSTPPADDEGHTPGGRGPFDWLFGRFGTRRTAPGGGPTATPEPDWKDGEIAVGEIVGAPPGATPRPTPGTEPDDAEVVHDPATDGIFPRTPIRIAAPASNPTDRALPLGARMSNSLIKGVAETLGEVLAAAARTAASALGLSQGASAQAAAATRRSTSAAALSEQSQALSSNASLDAAYWANTAQHVAGKGGDAASVTALMNCAQSGAHVAACAHADAETAAAIAELESRHATQAAATAAAAVAHAETVQHAHATLRAHQMPHAVAQAQTGNAAAKPEFLAS